MSRASAKVQGSPQAPRTDGPSPRRALTDKSGHSQVGQGRAREWNLRPVRTDAQGDRGTGSPPARPLSAPTSPPHAARGYLSPAAPPRHSRRPRPLSCPWRAALRPRLCLRQRRGGAAAAAAAPVSGRHAPFPRLRSQAGRAAPEPSGRPPFPSASDPRGREDFRPPSRSRGGRASRGYHLPLGSPCRCSRRRGVGRQPRRPASTRELPEGEAGQICSLCPPGTLGRLRAPP